MSLEIASFEIAVLLFGLLINIILVITGNIDSFREIRAASGLAKLFSERQKVAAMLVDIVMFTYFITRLHQWANGYHGYIIVDIATIILSINMYVSSYPFIHQTLKDIEILYKDKLKGLDKI